MLLCPHLHPFNKFITYSRVFSCFFLCRLKAHFESNPRDLGNIFCWIFNCLHDVYPFTLHKLIGLSWADLLKHDKILSKNPPAPHLRDVPDYLVDPVTQEASKIIKLARAAMGNVQSCRRRGFKRKSRNDKDPLKTFSAEVQLCLFQSWLIFNLTVISELWLLMTLLPALIQQFSPPLTCSLIAISTCLKIGSEEISPWWGEKRRQKWWSKQQTQEEKFCLI